MNVGVYRGESLLIRLKQKEQLHVLFEEYQDSKFQNHGGNIIV